MTDKAIEAACREMHKPDPSDEANPYVIACGWDQLRDDYKERYRSDMRAAIAAYEQALWRPIEEGEKELWQFYECWKPGWVRPCVLIWKTNSRIPDKGAYFGDPQEWDDYEMAEEQNKPTHYRQLSSPPLTQK